METKLFTVIYALFLIFAQNASADCFNCPTSRTGDALTVLAQKTYINLEQIAFHDSKIFIQLNNDVFPVPAIFSDQQGYYVLYAKGSRCPNWQWKCANPSCGTCNTYDYTHCPGCGWEMS